MTPREKGRSSWCADSVVEGNRLRHAPIAVSVDSVNDPSNVPLPDPNPGYSRDAIGGGQCWDDSALHSESSIVTQPPLRMRDSTQYV